MYAPQNAGELKLESPEIDEFEQLVFDWEDGQLDDVGINRLRQLLRESSDLRQRYVQRQVFAALVQMDRDAGLTTSSDEKVGCDSVLPVALANDSMLEQEKPDLRPGKSPTLVRQDSRGLGQRLKRHQGILLVAAASIMLCFVLGRWLVVESRLKQAGSNQSAEANERSGKQEATSAGVALVTRLVDVTWHESAKNYMVGDAVPAGMVSLDSGVAQIEFFCGATVILEGPAQLWLESSSMARLQSGRLRAQVPPAARGFQIQVDELKVVDLGTEFGIAVNQGQAEVHVFDGEVELHQTNGEQRSLMAGTAVKRAEDGALRVADLNPNDFLGLERLNERVRSQKQSRYESWLAHSGELRKDPRVIVYYSMESDRAWTRKLTSSAVPVNRDLDAAVVGAKRVVGRWPQKSAIEFKRPGDRVRLDIPGQYGSLTFACWVKIDSLDRWYNSLFLTDSYQRGEPHWQILDTGQLFFSVRQGLERGKAHHKVLSPQFWNPSMSGRWLHIATTYDVEAKTTTHFLNGEALCEERIPDDLLVKQTRFGKATIGNWSSPTRPEADFAIRNLNGSMDEFVLFHAALTHREVKELYEQGRP